MVRRRRRRCRRATAARGSERRTRAAHILWSDFSFEMHSAWPWDERAAGARVCGSGPL